MQQLENLNLDYNRKIILVKALNKVTKTTNQFVNEEVAALVGLSAKSVQRDKKRFQIYFDSIQRQYTF